MSPEVELRELPRGTVTFLFTDIEGSTELLTRLGRERYGVVLGEHGRLLRGAFEAAGGRVVDTQGDAFFVAFPRAAAAVGAAFAAQQALSAASWPDGGEPRVRIGVHTGEAELEGERYVGLAVHKAQRICAAAHGGQTLLSSTTRDVVEDSLPEGAALRDAGTRTLKDIRRRERLWQLGTAGAAVPASRRASVAERATGLPVRTVTIGIVVLVLVGLPLAAILVGAGAPGVVAVVVLIIALGWVVRR